MAFGFQTKNLPTSSRSGKKDEETRDQGGKKGDQKAGALPIGFVINYADDPTFPPLLEDRRASATAYYE
jgi:hypothetical protein